MARSHRYTPIMGITTCRSEKLYKQDLNRALRRKTRMAVAAGRDVLPVKNEIATLWDFGKDGKQYVERDRIAEMPYLLRK